MKYTALAFLGVCSIVAGYIMMKTGGRVIHVACERTENAFLPVCSVGEYFLGIPNGRAQKVAEITQLANTGKEKRQFFLMQRLPDKKVAPINLNKVRADGRSPDQEPIASLNRLADFFRVPDAPKVEVKLANEAGNVPAGSALFFIGIAMVIFARLKRQPN